MSDLFLLISPRQLQPDQRGCLVGEADRSAQGQGFLGPGEYQGHFCTCADTSLCSLDVCERPPDIATRQGTSWQIRSGLIGLHVCGKLGKTRC